MEGCEFLRLVASAYVQNKGESVRESTFVFPNRRSLIFFQKYLGEEYGKRYSKPLFSPQMLTISELFISISGLKQVDPIEAQYILYKQSIGLKYRNDSLESAMERETFDEFLHWGHIIISDFNDIDKYLIDAAQLFTNIKDLKQLDADYSFLSENQRKAVDKFWHSFLKCGENFKKESFSTLWNIMYELYISFRRELECKGEGYEGMIYRSVAENPDRCQTDNLVFIGFNAPNKCEKRLMRWLKEQGRCDFYWDFYGPMVTDRENKASMFIADAVKEFPSKYPIESVHPLPQIKTIGVPSGVGQALAASDILREIGSCDPIKTAVVLPDENLLMPLLNSIPEEFGSVNVTMGYPISATPLTGFIKALAALQKGVRVRNGVASFYSRSVMELLRTGYVKEHAAEEAASIIAAIVKSNIIFLPSDSGILQGIECGLLKSIFAVPDDSCAMLEYLIRVLKELDLLSSALDKEFIYRYYLAIERLKRLAIPMRKETCLKLLLQITSSITVPFNGEPLAGLQVIGSLEVRALDFDNLIILSVNEGTFPSSLQSNSLIPYNLRVGFGLPTYELQDAIAAYHFYRSIYRAKRVWLIYDTRTEGLKSGEVSRFIKQLEYQYSYNLKKSLLVSTPVLDGKRGVIEVKKNEKVLQRLYEAYIHNGGAKRLSASAINTYITCPLLFYLQYVMGIREEEQIEESVEAGTFGTIFHDTMEQLYSPYVGEMVSEEILDSIIKDKQHIEKVILEKFRDNRIAEVAGRNVIVKEVIKKYVLITLNEDKKYAPFNYIAGEETFFCNLPLSNGKSVRFKAVIDRIDSTSTSLRVIDYKTGKVEFPHSETTMAELFERNSDKQYKAFVQLYLYALVLALNSSGNGVLKLKSGKKADLKLSDETSGFDVVVYPVTTLKKSSIVCEPIYKSNLESYKDALMECVEEIFDENTPFVQAMEGCKACSWCMFKQICGR